RTTPGRPLVRRRPDRRLHGTALAVAHVGDSHFGPDAQQPDAITQIVAVADLAAIDRDDHVAGLEADLLGRRSGLDLRDQRATLDGKVERLGELRRDRLDEDAELPAAHLAVLDQLLHDAAGDIRRDRETDTDVAAGRRDDRRVDADEQAVHRDQRAPGIPRIDRRIGLDEVLVTLLDQPRAPERADDAGGHRLAERERVADRDDEVADLELARVTHRHLDEVVRLDLQ